MRNSLDGASLAAVITGVSISSPVSSTATAPVLLSHQTATYTTQDPHNFKVGQSATVTGLSGTNSSTLNINGSLIVNVPSSNSFSIYVPNTYPGTVTASSGVITTVAPTIASTTTAWVTNSWASQNRIQYASPAPTKNTPWYLDTTPNIIASFLYYNGDGTVSYNINWSALGASNPQATVSVYYSGYSSGTIVTSTTAVTGSSNVTLQANQSYLFTITASNAVGVKTATAPVTTNTQLSDVPFLTAVNTPSTSNSITLSWSAPTTAAPAITTYYIQRAISSDNITFTDFADLTTATASAVTTTDTTISNGTYYKYRIRAYNGISYTNWVTSAANLPYFITTPMVQPSINYVSTSTTAISIMAYGYISNPPVSSWTVQRSTSNTSGATWTTITSSAPTLPYSDTTVSQNTLYYYRISGSNGQVTSATSIASVSITTYAVPSAPSGVTAVASTTNVVVNWTASTVTTTDTPVLNYIVERSPNNSTWTTLTTAVSGGSTTYTDSTANNSGTYYYRISAVNGIGTSSTAVSGADYYAIATTPVAVATASTANQITVSWTAPSSNPAITNYKLEKATSADSYATWTTATTTTSTSYVDSSISYPTSYQYRLTVNNAQVSSVTATSTTVQPYFITTPTNTPTVSYVSTSSASLSVGSVAYVSNPTISSWLVERSTSSTSGATWTTVATAASSLPYVDSTVAQNTGYYYRITAKNAQLTAAVSSLSNKLTTYSIPTAPTGVSAIASTSGTTVTWTASTVTTTDTPVINYGIDRSADNSTWTTITTAISGSATTYTDTVGTSNSVYYYRVYAINGIGNSSYSSSTLPYYANSATPTAAATASTANSITVSWSAPTSNPSISNYLLEKSSSTDNATWGSWTTATTTPSVTYIDTSALSSTYYRYRLTVNNAQVSSPSVISNSTQAYYITSPMTTPGVSATNTTSANVTVGTVTYISNPAISSWKVERSTNSTTWNTLSASTTLPYTDTTTSQNTTYYYRITGTNGQLTSTSAASTSILTYAVPSAPTSLTATSPAYNTVNLSWTAAATSTSTPVIDYKIERATNSGFTTGLTTLSITVTGITYSDTTTSQTTTYYYRVSARNGLGYSSVSSSATVTTPYQPINTTITATSTTSTYPTLVTISGTVLPVPTGGTVGVTWTSASATTTNVNTTTGAWSIPNIGFTGAGNPFTATYSGYNGYQTSATSGTYTINQATADTTLSITGATQDQSGALAWNSGSAVTLDAYTYNPADLTAIAGIDVTFSAYNPNTTSYDVIGTATSSTTGHATLSWTTSTTAYTYVQASGNSVNYSVAGDLRSIYIRTKYTSTYTPSGTLTSVASASGTTRAQVASTFTMPTVSGATNYTINSFTIKMAGNGGSASIVPMVWTGAGGGGVVQYQGSLYTTVASAASPVVYTFSNVNLAMGAGNTWYVGFWRLNGSPLQWNYGTSTGNTTVYDNNATSPGTLDHDVTNSNMSLNYTVNYSYYK